jgi:peptidoglycan/xylan/chitin deacetylase (PgdA/CDA1 family)
MTWLKENHGRSLVSLNRGMSAAVPGIAITFDDGYLDNLKLAAPILCELSIPFTVFVVPEYIRRQSPLHLSEAALRELSTLPGCTIGSHGNTHIHLAQTDEKKLHEELRVSRLWIEEKIEKQVHSIAYPYGSANRRVRDAVKQAGYELGFCSRTGLNAPGRDLLLLCRTEVLRRDDMRLFKLKVQGAWDWHRYRHRDPARI